MVTSYEVRGMRSIQAGMPIVYISYSTGAPFSCCLRADQTEKSYRTRGYDRQAGEEGQAGKQAARKGGGQAVEQAARKGGDWQTREDRHAGEEGQAVEQAARKGGGWQTSEGRHAGEEGQAEEQSG